MGGLLKIWVIPYKVYRLSGKDLSFTDTSEIYELYCSPESMQFTEKKTNDESLGIYYTVDLNSFIPSNVEGIQEAIDFIEPRDHVILFQDGNEKFKLAGNNLYPLELTPSFNSGKTTDNRSGWNFKFHGNTIERAVEVNNPF